MSNTTSTPKGLCRTRVLLLSLTVFMLITSLIGINVFARWLTSSIGSDQAQVAIFALSANSADFADLSISAAASESTANYTFTVYNQENGITSQVSLRYEIDVTLPKALPDGVTVTIDGISGVMSADGLIYTFTSSGWEFPAAVSDSRDHVLTFTVDFDTVTDDHEFSGIRIGVNSEQIQ